MAIGLEIRVASNFTASSDLLNSERPFLEFCVKKGKYFGFPL